MTGGMCPHCKHGMKGDSTATGMHGEMAYMENHFDKRLDPRKLVPGAKSVISLLYNYFPSEHQRQDSYKVSKYAYGEDYHFVLKRKLKELLGHIEAEIGAVHGRAFVDSAPVLDRAWAARSGSGRALVRFWPESRRLSGKPALLN